MAKKKIISRFMAALMAAFILCFSVVPVSALTVPIHEDIYYQSGYGVGVSDTIIDSFYNNPSVFALGYNQSNSFLSISYNSYYNKYSLACIKSDDASYFTASNYNSPVFISSPFVITGYLDYNVDFSTYNFTIYNNNLQSGNADIVGIACNNDGCFWTVNAYYDSYYRRYSLSNNYTTYNRFLFYYKVPLLFESSDNTVLPLGIDVESFFNWYMSTNDRYKNQLYAVEEGSNFKILDDNLKYLLDYFNEYGADLSCFYSHYPELVPCYKNPDFVGPPAKNDFINLFTILKQHYNFYLKSKSMYLPTVKPNVTEDDTTLITDIDIDTVDISLLREILRTLILTYNSVNDVDYDLSSYIFNMYLKIDSLVDNIDTNFTLLRNDLNSNFVNLSGDIGVAVAANLNPTLNAMALGVADIDANVEANLQAVNNIDASLNEVNNSVDNLDISLHEINNTLNDGSGSGSDSGGCSGSRPCTPDLPEAEFDDLYEQSGDFFKFFRDLLDSSGWIPASLFTAACLVAIFMRVWGR